MKLVWARAFVLVFVVCQGLVMAQGDETGDVAAQSMEQVIPPMYVLNLDRSKERWETAKAVMQEAGLDVNRFPAVDGRQLSKEELLKESTRMAAFFQPRGVIGCYLSHKKFWKMVVDNDLPAAIVFEDDVELVDGFKEKLQYNLGRLAAEKDSKSQNYDVIMLGAIGRVHPQGKDAIGSLFFSHYIGGKRPLKIINDYRYQPRRPAGTHAYMVSNKGARKLLELCKKASYHVDLDAWRHPELDITMFQPMLAYQTFEHTSLTDVKRERNPVARTLLSTGPMKRLREWAADPHTRQPWSHVLAEPLIQLGKNGPVLTVERHCIIVMSFVTATAVFEYKGQHKKAMYAVGGGLTFVSTIRSIIYLLMNWR